MPISDASKHRTPCEILREINDKAQGILPDNAEIRRLACELEIMLKGLLPEIIDANFDVNEDFEMDAYKRALPNYRYEGETLLSIKDCGKDEDGTPIKKVIRC